jgi:hypothetical protein
MKGWMKQSNWPVGTCTRGRIIVRLSYVLNRRGPEITRPKISSDCI